MSLFAIVLAAGQGTRMRSDLAKVLHRAAGRTLIDWSLSALADLPLDAVVVVVGHQAGAVGSAIAEHDLAPLVATAVQAEQLGTGHAAAIGLGALDVAPDDVIIILPGDMPLLRRETIGQLVDHHASGGEGATVVTAVVSDPRGYGRVIRSGERIIGIVEEADASAVEAAICEVNTSVYLFQAGDLGDHLGALGTANAQGEQYLTDIVGILASSGKAVAGFVIDAEEAMGVNTVEQLAAAEALLVSRTR